MNHGPFGNWPLGDTMPPGWDEPDCEEADDDPAAAYRRELLAIAPPCIHSQTGLCDDCRRDFDADPESWLEYGDHQEGLKRWADLQAEMDAYAVQAAREREAVGETVSTREQDDEIPF